jgi:hypothetical protein
MQATVHRGLLEGARLFRTDHVEHRAQPALLRQRHRIHPRARFGIRGQRLVAVGGGRRADALVVVLHELADLLLQRHLLEQRVNPALDLGRRQLRVRRRRGVRQRKGNLRPSLGAYEKRGGEQPQCGMQNRDR